MQLLMVVLVALLVICALCVTFTRRLLPSVIIFMAYSLITSIIWMILQSPDLAITEAAVGAGITTVLFFAAFKRMGLFEASFREEHEILEPMHEHGVDEDAGGEE